MAKKPGFPGAMALGKPKPDLGAPSDFGAPPPAPPGEGSPFPPPGGSASGADPDADQDTTGALISPTAVNYHADEQHCDICDHYGDDGTCAVLQMPVEAAGGCNAFSAKDGDQDDSGMGPGDDGGDQDQSPLAPSGPGSSRGAYGG